VLKDAHEVMSSATIDFEIIEAAPRTVVANYEPFWSVNARNFVQFPDSMYSLARFSNSGY
jgi:hypothetical protein